LRSVGLALGRSLLRADMQLHRVDGSDGPTGDIREVGQLRRSYFE